MEPKDKALELINKFLNIENGYDTDLFCDECGMSEKAAILCSLIAVDDIINSVENEHVSEIFENYWIEVEKEILTIKNKL